MHNVTYKNLQNLGTYFYIVNKKLCNNRTMIKTDRIYLCQVLFARKFQNIVAIKKEETRAQTSRNIPLLSIASLYSRVTLLASITRSVLLIWHYPHFFFFILGYLDRTRFNRSADSALSLSSYFLEVSDNGRGTYLREGRRSALRAMHFICSAEIRSRRSTTPRNRVETRANSHVDSSRATMRKWGKRASGGCGNVCS